jgi:hypothetical protein
LVVNVIHELCLKHHMPNKVHNLSSQLNFGMNTSHKAKRAAKHSCLTLQWPGKSLQNKCIPSRDDIICLLTT